MTRLTGTDAWGLMEAYNAVYAPQEINEEQNQEDFEIWVNSLLDEGYDLSEYTWDEMFEIYEAKEDEGLSPLQKIRKRNKKGNLVMRPGDQTRERRGYHKAGRGVKKSEDDNWSPGKNKWTREADVKKKMGSEYGERHERNRRAVTSQERVGGKKGLPEDFENWVNSLVEEGYDLSEYTWDEMYEEWKQDIMEMPFPKVQVTNRPGDFGAGQMTLIRTHDGREGYVNPHSRGNILSPGTTNKIMRGDLMVKGKEKSKPTTQVAHFDLYDYIKGYLIDEGYADTEQDALVIMTNMSEDWKDHILEAKVDKVVDKQLQKSGADLVTRMQAKKNARKSRKPGLTPRTGRQWQLAQRLSDMKDRQTEYPLRGSKRGAESPAD